MLQYVHLLWRPVLEISFLWFIFYRLLIFFEGTRAVNLLRGVIVLIIAFFFSQQLGLVTIEWLLNKLFAFWLIAIIIIFQPEFRHGLAKLGRRHLFHLPPKEEEVERMIKELVKTIKRFSYEHIGALIALERQQKLRTFTESGVPMDSMVSSELLHTIFIPGTPLHDGGIIISGNRIVAAACLFPLTQQKGLSPSLGTRHRAAIGLSEETDALVLVVSEENGNISLALDGRLNSTLDLEKLDEFIKYLLLYKG